MGSGVYVTQATDLEIPAVGFPLVLARNYETTQAIDSPTGYGWTSSLSARLYYTTYLFAAPSTYQKQADITMPNGARYRFVDNGNGTFTPPLGRHDTLVRNGDGTFDLTIQRTMSVYHFGADGSLLTMSDDYNNTTALTYDGNGRLQRITDASGSGRYMDVFWGADGRISVVQDHTDRQVQYTYDNRGAMTSMTDPLGRTTYYTYVQGRFTPLLAAVTDNWNRPVTSVTYDSVERVSSYTEQGETWSYAYNYQNNPLKTAKFDSLGNTWIYTFNQAGLVTDAVAPASGGGGSLHTDYYVDGSTQKTIDEVGVKTYYTYNNDGYVVSVTKDHQGSQAVRHDYTYDPNFPGRVTSVTPRNPSSGQIDPNWQAWRYDYYQAGSPAPGALNHVYRVQRNGTTLDTIATYVYDNRGRVTSRTNAGGEITSYTYDLQGNLETVIRPPNNDSGLPPTTTYGHDAIGRVTSVTDAMGSVTSYTYDAVGRLSELTLPAPAPASALSFTMTFANDDFDSATGLVFSTVTDPAGNITRQGFDAYGRIGRNVDALNAQTRYAYTGALFSSLTDAHDNVTTYSYDALKRLLAITFPDGRQERYTYYPDGSLKTKTDRKNQTISYSYDHLLRLAAITYPDATSITFTYTGQEIKQVVDTSVSPSETHVFNYDNSYRLSSETQGPRGTLNYTYTAADRKASYAVVGGESATYSYYPDGSVDTIAWSPIAGDFKFIYNLRGQYEQITFPNGQHRAYDYDGQGRPLRVENTDSAGGNFATYDYGYDVDNSTGQPAALGLRTSMIAEVPAQGFSAARTKYYYDKLYQLLRVDYPQTAPFDGQVDQWTYDLIGNRLTNSVNGETKTYSYEHVGANPKNWRRLASDGVDSYTLDANGSVLSIGSPPGQSFTWDYENRALLRSGADWMASRNDYRGRRAAITRAKGTSSYLFVDDTPVEVRGAMPAAVLVGPLRDEPLAIHQDGTVYFAVLDDHDSVVELADTAGTVRYQATYDAWGRMRSTSGDVESRLGYIGLEADGADFWLTDARYYSPGIGRFLQEDPGGMDARTEKQWSADLAMLGMTLESARGGGRGWASAPALNVGNRSYEYGGNNPVLFRDLGGRKPMPLWVLTPITFWQLIEEWKCDSEREVCKNVCLSNGSCCREYECGCTARGRTGTDIACEQRCYAKCEPARARCREFIWWARGIKWVWRLAPK